MTVTLTGDGLTIPELVAVARGDREVRIAEDTLTTVAAAREDLEARIEHADGTDEAIYGVTTGFGALADRRIPGERRRQLQTNLIRSHAVGVGDPLAEDEARGMMLTRLNSLLSGRSGVRVAVVELLEGMLNGGVYPRVPRKGSASASGDLAPLAHLVLVMLGEGEARVDGEWVPGAAALERAGLDPISLREKEGLALINGTNYVAAVGALAVHDAYTLVDSADAVGAMSLEAQRGISDAFVREIHDLRGHAGQITSAEHIRSMYGHDGAESDLVTAADDADHVQDEYSLRCMPQVHGATRDVVDFAAETVERELNAVTDNPLVLEEAVVSGGNFHGQPVALALDALTTAVAELADISERRLFSLLGGDDEESLVDALRAELRAVEAGEKTADEAFETLQSRVEAVAAGDETVDSAVSDFEEERHAGQLPRFLAGGQPGLHSGFMMTQVTAAALVSENRTLAHPDSSDSVPTSDNQEDHVSMGANAANHLTEVLDNVTTVLAIETFAAFQALTLRERSPGPGTREKLDLLDRHEEVRPVEEDRILLDDIHAIRELIRDEQFVP